MKREMTIDIATYFATQFGLAADIQLRASGVTPDLFDERLSRGDWRRVCPGVVALEGAPPSWEQAAMATTLAPGRAVASHGTALRLHGMDGFDDFTDIHVMIGRGGHVDLPADVIVHESRRFRPSEVVMRSDIRTTSLATALVLAPGFHDDVAVGKALDHALRDGARPAWLTQTADHWRGKGVPGSGVLFRMLGERIGQPLPKSWYQRLAKAAFERRGIVLEDEHPVKDGGRTISTIDLASPELLVGVECQSTRWHADPDARVRNLDRKRRLRLLGWDIVEVWWSDLDRIEGVLGDVLVSIDRQRRLLGR